MVRVSPSGQPAGSARRADFGARDVRMAVADAVEDHVGVREAAPVVRAAAQLVLVQVDAPACRARTRAARRSRRRTTTGRRSRRAAARAPARSPGPRVDDRRVGRPVARAELRALAIDLDGPGDGSARHRQQRERARRARARACAVTTPTWRRAPAPRGCRWSASPRPGPRAPSARSGARRGCSRCAGAAAPARSTDGAS